MLDRLDLRGVPWGVTACGRVSSGRQERRATAVLLSNFSRLSDIVMRSAKLSRFNSLDLSGPVGACLGGCHGVSWGFSPGTIVEVAAVGFVFVKETGGLSAAGSYEELSQWPLFPSSWRAGRYWQEPALQDVPATVQPPQQV